MHVYISKIRDLVLDLTGWGSLITILFLLFIQVKNNFNLNIISINAIT